MDRLDRLAVAIGGRAVDRENERPPGEDLAGRDHLVGGKRGGASPPPALRAWASPAALQVPPRIAGGKMRVGEAQRLEDGAGRRRDVDVDPVRGKLDMRRPPASQAIVATLLIVRGTGTSAIAGAAMSSDASKASKVAPRR